MIYTKYDGPESEFIEIGPAAPKKKIFKVSTIYGHGGHLGHVTLTIYTNFDYPFLRIPHIKFGFYWLSGSWEK